MKKQRQQAFAQRTPDNEKQSNSAVQLAHPELELRRLDELGEPVTEKKTMSWTWLGLERLDISVISAHIHSVQKTTFTSWMKMVH